MCIVIIIFAARPQEYISMSALIRARKKAEADEQAPAQ